MPKYMVLYNSSTPAAERMAKASPEAMKASMDEWIKWSEEAKKTVGFDFGMPLQVVSRVTAEGITESNNQTSGSSTMDGNEEDIIKLLKSHPHLKNPGTSIDVLEMLSMPGM